MDGTNQRGFSLVELLVSMAVLSIIVIGLAQMMIENSKINRSQQLTANVQANARNSLSMVVQRLRSAGWDPMNAGGIPQVVTDADLSDTISEIEVFADLDEDGFTNGLDEQVLIQHTQGQIVWRRTNDTTDPFIVLASNISNDADGDGTIEPMFLPVPSTSPTRVVVQITAEAPVPDPMTGKPIRYTVSSDVSLRKAL